MRNWVRNGSNFGLDVEEELENGVDESNTVSTDAGADESKVVNSDDVVDESKPKENSNESFINLTLISPEGSVWNANVPKELRITQFKTMCIAHFYDGTESMNRNYKLLLVSPEKIIDETIKVGGLVDGDEILLIPRTSRENPILLKNDAPPSREDILAATEKLPARNVLKVSPRQECPESYNADFRRILISLVHVCANVCNESPDAIEIMTSISQKFGARARTIPNPGLVTTLVGTGFTKGKVKLALRLKRNNANDALDWLLDQMDYGSTVDDENDTGDLPPIEMKESLNESIISLLEVLKMYRRIEFTPNGPSLQILTEMGFSREQAIEALCITDNNPVASCDWLLGEKTEEEVSADVGISKDSDLFKSLLDNTAIAIALSSPKSLMAFLSIMENRDSISMWLIDPDTQNVVNQIFKVYHFEKKVESINRQVVGFIEYPETTDERLLAGLENAHPPPEPVQPAEPTQEPPT